MVQTTSPGFIEEVKRYRLSRSDRELPYGVGCAWLGRNDLNLGTSYREKVLENAYELGIRYFDTSSAYGDSEVVVGEFVAEIPRNNIFLATKSRIPEHLSPIESKRHLKAQIEKSLMRLKSNYVDLFQIHDVGGLSQVFAVDGAIDALIEAKREGVVRFVGLATRDHGLLKEAASSGLLDTVLTYSDFTPIDQSASKLIRFANERKVGVINGSPLSAGLLNGKDPRHIEVHLHHAESVKRKQAAIGLFDLCTMHDISMLQAALQFPLREEGIHMNLTGPSNKAELLASMKALEEPVPALFWQNWEFWISHNKKGGSPC
jgi:aryl-alcohol dehydrogenase-like predicted oxidoreductase